MELESQEQKTVQNPYSSQHLVQVFSFPSTYTEYISQVDSACVETVTDNAKINISPTTTAKIFLLIFFPLLEINSFYRGKP